MPLPLQSIAMSMDEFHVMPHQLGWKHEYWDGMARLSPHHSAIVDFMLPLRDDEITSGDANRTHDTWRNVQIADAEQLERLHRTTFDQAVEYAGCTEEYYLRSIHESIAAFFGLNDRRSRGAPEHSFVVDSDGDIVAAILVRHASERFVIEPVMVDSSRQRQGLGRRLLRLAVDSLRRVGVEHLHSRCHLANSTSLQWHKANGFQEQLHFLAAGHLAMHHDWMSRHHEAAGRKEESETARRFAGLYHQLRDALQELDYFKFRSLQASDPEQKP